MNNNNNIHLMNGTLDLPPPPPLPALSSSPLPNKVKNENADDDASTTTGITAKVKLEGDDDVDQLRSLLVENRDFVQDEVFAPLRNALLQGKDRFSGIAPSQVRDLFNFKTAMEDNEKQMKKFCRSQKARKNHGCCSWCFVGVNCAKNKKNIGDFKTGSDSAVVTSLRVCCLNHMRKLHKDFLDPIRSKQEEFKRMIATFSSGNNERVDIGGVVAREYSLLLDAATGLEKRIVDWIFATHQKFFELMLPAIKQEHGVVEGSK